MTVKKATALTAAALCAATVVGFAVRAAADAKAKPAEEKLPDIIVNTSPVKMQELVSTVDFVATLKASESVNVFPKLGGRVAKTYFEAGDKVKAGDVLFEIDTSDYMTALDNAKAAEAVAVASYNKQTGSGLEQSLLALEMQRAMAAISSDTSGDKIDDLLEEQKKLRKQYNEAKEALGKSPEEYQQDILEAKAQVDLKANALANAKAQGKTLAEIQTAEAELNAASANYENVKAGYEKFSAIDSQLKTVNISLDAAYKADDPLSAQQYYYYQQYDLAAGKGAQESEALAQAQLKQAMVAVKNAEKQIEDCVVKAPISGVIQQKNVKTYEMAGSSMAAYVITVNNSLNVEFSVSDRYVHNIRVNDTVKVDTAAGVKTAVVTEISENADAKTGLFLIKALIDNSDGRLKAGSAVTVTVNTQRTGNTVTVPVKSVRYQNEEAFVYRLVDGKAVRTVVKTGISDEKYVEITSGISNDDVIITTWHPNLRDGVAVVQAQQ